MTQQVPQVGDVWEYRGEKVVIDSIVGRIVYFRDRSGILRGVSRDRWYLPPNLVERDGKAWSDVLRQ